MRTHTHTCLFIIIDANTRPRTLISSLQWRKKSPQWPSSIWIILRSFPFRFRTLDFVSNSYLLFSLLLKIRCGVLLFRLAFLFCLQHRHHHRRRAHSHGCSSPIEPTIYMQLWYCHCTIGFNLTLLPFVSAIHFWSYLHKHTHSLTRSLAHSLWFLGTRDASLTPIMFIIIKPKKTIIINVEKTTRTHTKKCNFAIFFCVSSGYSVAFCPFDFASFIYI